LDHFGDGVGCGTSISPFHDLGMLVYRSLTKPQGVYLGSDTAKVQSVGIPTGLNRRVVVDGMKDVTDASHEEKIEIVVVQVEQLTTQFSGKTRSKKSM
jgi:hypothetical protein